MINNRFVYCHPHKLQRNSRDGTWSYAQNSSNCHTPGLCILLKFPLSKEMRKHKVLGRAQAAQAEFSTSMILPAGFFFFYLHTFSHPSCKYRIPESFRWEKTSRTIKSKLCLIPTLSPAQSQCHIQAPLEHQALAPTNTRSNGQHCSSPF